jgi:hypothetical protein
MMISVITPAQAERKIKSGDASPWIVLLGEGESYPCSSDGCC